METCLSHNYNFNEQKCLENIRFFLKTNSQSTIKLIGSRILILGVDSRIKKRLFLGFLFVDWVVKF